MPRHSTDPGLGANEIDVLRKRERYGWFVTMIAADVAGPGFAYSFGLYQEFEHPEVILFGLPGSTLHRLVDDLGEPLPVCKAARRDGIHTLVARHKNMCLRRIPGLTERVDADSGKRIDSVLRITVLYESPGQIHDPVGKRLCDEVILRQIALITGRHQQEFSAFAFVWSEGADFCDRSLPVIVDDPVSARWRIDDDRAISLKIDTG